MPPFGFGYSNHTVMHGEHEESRCTGGLKWRDRLVKSTSGEYRASRFRWRRRRQGDSSKSPDASTTIQIPKLTSDARRTFIAFLSSIIPGTYFDDFLEHLDFGLDEWTSDVGFLICSILAGWILLSTIYIVLTFVAFARPDGETLAHWLRESTPRTRFARLIHSGSTSTIWTTHGSLIAVLAALVLSLIPDLRGVPVVMICAVMGIAATWLLNATSFAVHYARKDANERGLAFPNDIVPTFADYFYFSIQVSTGYSSSDVTTLTKTMRRAITAHTMLAFTFNTVIIAILVSILMSAVT